MKRLVLGLLLLGCFSLVVSAGFDENFKSGLSAWMVYDNGNRIEVVDGLLEMERLSGPPIFLLHTRESFDFSKEPMVLEVLVAYDNYQAPNSEFIISIIEDPMSDILTQDIRDPQNPVFADPWFRVVFAGTPATVHIQVSKDGTRTILHKVENVPVAASRYHRWTLVLGTDSYRVLFDGQLVGEGDFDFTFTRGHVYLSTWNMAPGDINLIDRVTVGK